MGTLARPILFYDREGYYLSNFSAFAVEIWGEVWMTAEHAYQVAKFLDPDIRLQIARARSPHDAKKIARANKAFIRPDWDSIKLSVMERVLRAKLEQHPWIAEQLLLTGECELIEDSPKDDFWGRGPNWRGENWLGKLWMKLRSELRLR